MCHRLVAAHALCPLRRRTARCTRRLGATAGCWALGRGLRTGVEAGAQTFFNKHAKDLTLEEAALLAAIPKAPGQYSPTVNPEAV